MIEKIKDYLFVDDLQQNEEQGFSIIKTIPSLNFTNQEEDITEDSGKVFFDGRQKIEVCVRSEEARDDVYSFLTAYGFNCILWNDELGRRSREFYNTTENPEEFIKKYCLGNFKVGMTVDIQSQNLSKFKETLHKLRKQKSYRTAWKHSDKIIIG